MILSTRRLSRARTAKGSRRRERTNSRTLSDELNAVSTELGLGVCSIQQQTLDDLHNVVAGVDGVVIVADLDLRIRQLHASRPSDCSGSKNSGRRALGRAAFNENTSVKQYSARAPMRPDVGGDPCPGDPPRSRPPTSASYLACA